MNRNITIEVFLLIVILSIPSCEKEIDYPRKFIFRSYSPGSIKLYTNSGEVSDPDKINRFISGSDDYFWINTDYLNSLSRMPLTDTLAYQNNYVVFMLIVD